MAPPRWAAGLGGPELKDISGNCPARDMSLHPKAPPVQARRYREENDDTHTTEQNAQTTL